MGTEAQKKLHGKVQVPSDGHQGSAIILSVAFADYEQMLPAGVGLQTDGTGK